MQERDEDLAQAYDDINRLEQQRLKFIISLLAMGIATAGMAAVTFLLRRR